MSSRFVRGNDGLYRWDAASAKKRWGPQARNPGPVELIEELLERGRVKSAFDTLFPPKSLRRASGDEEPFPPSPLKADEARYLAGRIINRALELTVVLTQSERDQLLEQAGIPRDLKTRRRKTKMSDPRVAEIAAKSLTLSEIEEAYEVSRSTAKRLRKAAREHKTAGFNQS